MREVILPKADIPPKEVILRTRIRLALTQNMLVGIMPADTLNMEVATLSTVATQITTAALPTGHPHLR